MKKYPLIRTKLKSSLFSIYMYIYIIKMAQNVGCDKRDMKIMTYSKDVYRIPMTID